MHDEWVRHIEAEYNRALNQCSGVLVNAEGKANHIDGYSLFSGPATRAHRYASWELERYWEHRPRLTLIQFEEQWVQGVEMLEAA